VTNDLRQRLHDADPLESEPALSTADVHAMRRTILSADHSTSHRGNRARRTAAGAIVLACTVAAGVFVATWLRSDPVGINAPGHQESRQLQFETPGGTRIIWVLNPDLEL